MAAVGDKEGHDARAGPGAGEVLTQWMLRSLR